MSIELFEHNKTAYKSAVVMLAETGKAAVIHLTGTGKSFIGFKLCEDNPDKTVCWISPSRYIFKTQIENLKAAGSDVPQNIVFFTYKKLTLLSDDEINAIQPDYLIIDEYHRSGAFTWNDALNRLIEKYPNVPMLGLSATNIRYLDNQRDMAEKLFDGNIASEMTLGEIVRGILKAPLYVSTVYSYQKDLEKYTRMSKMPKFKAVRDTAEKYLEELRRTIEKADGLDVIFEKYMPDKHGKYVVFCSNKEHMDEMFSHVDEWFSKVDKSPKVYKVYSDNSEASGEFADFKADKSENLKLLFCIDMLNEGVHLDDIDGVILFRPTVSPTVYKQQIGRALTAGKSGTPVIFDIINNFENLYSMGAIEQEIACAVTYYNSLGESEKIVADKFEIIGFQWRDKKEIIWLSRYEMLKKYKKENGTVDVPTDYVIDGFKLGMWRQRQGNFYKKGMLTSKQIGLLREIGMCLDTLTFDEIWDRNYSAAEKWYCENGDLNVPQDYMTDDGIKLYSWLSNQKSRYADGRLTRGQIDKLCFIGFEFENKSSAAWKNAYRYAEEYYRANSKLDVPSRYKLDNGFDLGYWLFRQRKNKAKLSDEQIKLLDSIGMVWSAPAEMQ